MMGNSLSERIAIRFLVDIVTERIEEAIVSGELAPGARISEMSLARNLGVSRGPLREAIRRLEGRKLVERTPNKGVHIASLSFQDLMDLLDVREALEGKACALAAERISKEELDALEQLLDDHAKHRQLQSGKGYYQESKDFDFHFRIARSSGNERLISIICGDLYHLLRIYRYKSSTFSGRAARALEEHRNILAALQKRNPNLAEKAMRTHIRNAQQHLRLALKSGKMGCVRNCKAGPLFRE